DHRAVGPSPRPPRRGHGRAPLAPRLVAPQPPHVLGAGGVLRRHAVRDRGPRRVRRRAAAAVLLRDRREVLPARRDRPGGAHRAAGQAQDPAVRDLHGHRHGGDGAGGGRRGLAGALLHGPPGRL
ncbi:MAG: hypothetical protein AVDCRST_MAG06-2235, partial [uncultured Nocardioides sp.]